MFQAYLVLYLPQPCQPFSPRTLGSFSEEWYLETKIWALFTDCHWGVSSPWPSQWIKLRNMCLCVYTFISTYTYLQIENHEFTPIPPIPTQYHRVYFSSHSPGIFVSPSTISENLVSHWLLHVNFFAQLPYVINFLIPRGPVETLHKTTNPCWLVSPHINMLPVAQLLPCNLHFSLPFTCYHLPLGNCSYHSLNS